MPVVELPSSTVSMIERFEPRTLSAPPLEQVLPANTLRTAMTEPAPTE